jgi:ribosomal subunit interface protein
MKVNISIQDVNNGEKLKEQIQNRIEKLRHVYDEILSAEVFVKKQKAMDPSPKVVEMHVHVAGQNLFAKKEADKAEEAIDTAFEALNKQLLKFKNKKE